MMIKRLTCFHEFKVEFLCEVVLICVSIVKCYIHLLVGLVVCVVIFSGVFLADLWVSYTSLSWGSLPD